MQYEYSVHLIVFGLSLLALRRILRRSARVDSSLEDLYFSYSFIVHIVLNFISLIVSGSLWAVALVNFFLICLYYLDDLRSVSEKAFVLLSVKIGDFLILSTQRVRSYKIRGKPYKVLPGSRLLRLGRLFLPSQQIKTLEENIGDMRLERRAALDKQQYWRARIIVYVYYIMMVYDTVRFLGRKSSEIVGFVPKPDK